MKELNDKIKSPFEPANCYFSKVNTFIDSLNFENELGCTMRSDEERNFQPIEDPVVNFECMYRDWVQAGLNDCHKDVSAILKLAALIPPSTAEIERSFSLMKLICTPIRKQLDTHNMAQCMRICQYGPLNDTDYDEILRRWLEADKTKSKARRVVSRILLKI